MMSRSRRGIAFILVLAFCIGMILLAGCSKSGAEKQVEADLEGMRNIELDEELSSELESILSEEGKKNFGRFRELAGEYEVEIIDSEKSETDSSVTVTVRIRTYSFGREYLRTWTEYLENRGENDFSQSEFYELLMKNLSTLESKGYYSDVEVVCIEPVSDGSWLTDAATNAGLRDAILGGMPSEIAALAQE